MFGTVKFFNVQKGWGFLTPDNGDSEVFVHQSELEKSRLSLVDGDRVEFEVHNGKRGPVAVNIKLVPVAK